MTRWCLFVICFVLLQAKPIWSDEKLASKPSEEEIKGLIDQLVSPNPKAITGDEDEHEAPDYRLPSGFDREKQKPVHQAIERLKQIGPPAFPFLIERWGDKRYCVTVSHGFSGEHHNRTVGEVCQDIVYARIQPYGHWPSGYDDPRGKPKRPNYPGTFLQSQQAAKKWLEKYKLKTLYQIQLEALDWAIAEEAKRPQDFTDEERDALNRARAKLVSGGEPLRDPGLWEWGIAE